MKSATVILVGAGWLLTAAGSFYTGLRMSAESLGAQGREAGSESVELSDRPKRVGDAQEAGVAARKSEDPITIATSTGAIALSADLSASSLQESLDAILAEGDFLSRSSKLAGFLAKLDRGSLEEAKAYFAELALDGLEHNREIEMFLHAWARFDPAGAMDFARENIQGRGAMLIAASVLREWSLRDKGAALDWILAQEDGRARQMSLAILLSAEAGRNPAAAIETMKMVPEGQADARVVGMVAERLAATDPKAALSWATTLSDTELRDNAMRNIAEGWARKDPAAAAAWLLSNTRESFAPGAAREIVRTMVANDPTAAAAWVARLPQGEVAKSATAALASAWAARDPVAAGGWLNTLQQGDSTDAALDHYARQIAQTDPAAAVEWAATIADETLRRKALIELAGYWQGRNPQQAASYLGSLGLDEATLQEIKRASENRRPPWAGRGR